MIGVLATALPFARKHWQVFAAAGLLLVLGWGILRYGTMREERGAARGRIETTKELEANVRARYAAAQIEMEKEREAIAAERQTAAAERQAVARDRQQFERTMGTRIAALDSAIREDLQNASTVSDGDLRGSIRTELERLLARPEPATIPE